MLCTSAGGGGEEGWGWEGNCGEGDLINTTKFQKWGFKNQIVVH
jgi:hypothetical protein